MKKLRIGITCYPTIGGSGVIATELGKLLAERGHEIHFITSSLPFRLNRTYHNIFFHQVDVNHYSVFQYSPYDIALGSKMAEVAVNEELDLFHVHYAIPHAVCAILAKEMSGKDIKVVTTLHGTDITVLGYDSSLSNAIRFGIERSDAVTAVSKALIRETYDLIKPDKKIECVYNFIDEHDLIFANNDLRKNYGIKDNEKVIIHVSNFRSVKRVPDVVRSFAMISDKLPTKLLLVGDGPEMKVVTTLVDELGIRDKVLLVGKQENLSELYSISDLMLLLSEKESFGLVALEAMASGVPCIGTNIGGIPEVISDGENGFICQVGDIQDVSMKALTLLSDAALYERFSKDALSVAKERFSAEKIVKQYEEIYQQVLSQEGL